MKDPIEVEKENQPGYALGQVYLLAMQVYQWCSVRTSKPSSACPVKFKVKATSLLSPQITFCPMSFTHSHLVLSLEAILTLLDSASAEIYILRVRPCPVNIFLQHFLVVCMLCINCWSLTGYWWQIIMLYKLLLALPSLLWDQIQPLSCVEPELTL